MFEDSGDVSLGSAAEGADAGGVLLFFWGIGCSHCAQAKPFVASLARQYPKLRVESIEVRRDRAGRERFVATIRELGIQGAGIPTFAYGRGYVVGFQPGVTEERVRRLLQRGTDASSAAEGAEGITLPGIGTLHPNELSLPAFTVVIGLVDGINPCAMWVLLVLLGILVHVRSRRRLLWVGGSFVLMSGVVYFLFMTVWTGLFAFAGISREVTVALGVLVLLMGLVNLKELALFKRGPSLTIPDRAKPRLYRLMRRISSAASLPAAILGVLVLAFFVNLIELGCTLGLPAVYTRILSQRDLSAAARLTYLALYNVAYVVPLAAIVVAYAATLHRFALGERGAKLLKAVSGALLVGFGVAFIAWPEMLE